MIKLTKKNLKELATSNNAIYFVGNVYNYENIVHYINSLCYSLKHKNEEETNACYDRILTNSASIYHDNIIAFMRDLAKFIYNNDVDYTSDEKIAYSCGIYGNTGQLHKFNIWANGDIVKTFYTYY